MTPDLLRLPDILRLRKQDDDQQSRIQTGIPELDEVIGGGLPCDAIILLAGQLGAGRTTLALQIAHEVGSISAKTCLYVTFVESKETLFSRALGFGWNFQELEDNEIVRFIEARASDSEELEDNLSFILDSAAKMKPAVVIIDSLSAIMASLPKEGDLRPFLYALYKALHRMKVLAILIVDLAWGEHDIPPDVARFGDGILVMESSYDDDDSLKKHLRIPKLSGSDHTRKSIAYEIGEQGFVKIGKKWDDDMSSHQRNRERFPHRIELGETEGRMKLCQRCRRELADAGAPKLTAPSGIEEVLIVPESECEFWAHKELIRLHDDLIRAEREHQL